MDRFTEETPFFTAEHLRLAASVASFVWREIEPRAEADEEDTAEAHADERFRELVMLLAQAELLRYAVARAGAFDVRALCLIREELAYSSPLADLAFVMQGLGTYALSRAAPAHVRDFWLQRAAEGRAVAAFALTEPEVGSDISAIQTTARREGDLYVLDGRKRFISNAGIADFYTVFARTGTRADGRAEISAFVVGARMQGFNVRERTRLIAPHPIGEIEFDNLRVPAEDRVGAEGEGFRLALETLGTFRASVGAAACGMARRALDEAAAYAKRRQQFGLPLAAHQLIQEKLADMSVELDAARLLVYRAAYLRDTYGDDASYAPTLARAASTAKLYATEAAQRIIDQSLQIHGGAGLVHGHVCERLYRDIRALRIYEGTSEIQKLVIARELLKE
ncbi:MAG TPA: acyl-CoA dehydrogenase family protein [Pyrinomonadaceae bacterium]|nr:acyl-CoA dehydrogenase family protein [Pyrinomonadaceae bacterium]